MEGVTNDFVERNNYNLYVFTPENVKSSANPAIFYIYGNGWSFADIEYYRTYLQNLAKETGSIVISPNYRQAPESAFPAPFEDCLEAANYVFENAAALKIDPNNVVLSGDGTGATMALSLSLNMEDKKIQNCFGSKPRNANASVAASIANAQSVFWSFRSPDRLVLDHVCQWREQPEAP